MSTLDATRETARRPFEGRRVHLGDVVLQVAAGGAALGTLVLLGLIVYKVVQGARLSMSTFGLGFIVHTGWDPLHAQMGAGNHSEGLVPIFQATSQSPFPRRLSRRRPST